MKWTKFIKITWSVFVLALLAISPTAWAVPLAPSAPVLIAGTTHADRPELAGEVIRDELSAFEIRDAQGGLVFQGTIQQRVVRSNLDGTLDFYYRIRETDFAVSGSLRVVRTHGFASWTTDVDFRLDGQGDIGPASASRSADGDQVTFHFNPELKTGEESFFLLVKTNSVSMGETGLTILVGSGENTVELAAAGPVAPKTPYKLMPKNADPCRTGGGGPWYRFAGA